MPTRESAAGVKLSETWYNLRFRALPRLSPVPRVGGKARHEISNSFAAALVQQREYGALRVRAMNDPGAARHGSRAIEDLAAASLHALRRRLDVADVEIVKPEGKRQCRRLGEHAADRLPCGGELLIRAHRADVGVRFLPAK